MENSILGIKIFGRLLEGKISKVIAVLGIVELILGVWLMDILKSVLLMRLILLGLKLENHERAGYFLPQFLVASLVVLIRIKVVC